MKQNQRQQAILARVEKHGKLDIEQAVSEFGISPATARRDFAALAAEELIEKFRGGIRRKKVPRGGMTPFGLREVRNIAAKRAIAARAAELVDDGDVLMIDGGTSTLQLAQFFPDVTLRIITNSLRLVGALAEQKAARAHIPEIIVSGGTLYLQSLLLAGRQTQCNLKQYFADIAFLSVGGIAPDGITNTNERVVESEQVMIDHSEKVVVLADHSKIGQKAMCRVCDLERIDLLITDEHPDSVEKIEMLRQAGLQVVTVPTAAEE